MRVTPTALPDVKLIVPTKFEDERGFFVESYNQRALAAHGIDVVFVQDNHSLSRRAGVVRGLHFQTEPFAQHKLMRVTRGSIFDVAVDVRTGSPTFGRHVALRLNADDPSQLLIPVGFAHGFCTLEPDTEVMYKVSAVYSPEHDKGILWNDPALGIAWPVDPAHAVLSDKDKRNPKLADLPSYFRYAPPA
ncbi:MAG TPA: dTDP-4-dehydrorhamnose 3,5-epimerase [Candidatus Sulfotelmatobacter sp.]|nr:dTDP-4-dehydrorhamnose 3,5-epimerase [Candidatus Sulfotelmatobacter sp.]